MKIILIYFSATGNTNKIAHIIKKRLIELSSEVIELNITNRNQRIKELDLEEYNAALFGFPIYALRIPSPAREWIETINGKNKKCGMLFTYGGVRVGIVHYETKKLLESQNFKVIASAEFPMSHTYNLGGWNLNSERPNTKDREIAEQFADLFYKRLQETEPYSLSIPNPNIDRVQMKKVSNVAKHGTPIPIFVKEMCTLCEICTTLCPTGAITSGLINKRSCIRCYRCIINCPEGALKAPDLQLQLNFILNKTKLTVEEINGKKSKIIS